MQTKTISVGDFAWHSASNAYVLRLTLTEESTDEAANTSRIGYTLALLSGGNNRFSDTALYPSLSLAGSVVAHSDAQFSLDYDSSVTLLAGSADILHGDDGTLDMAVTASLDPAENRYAPPALTLSDTMALTPIARGAAVVPGASSAAIGSALRLRLDGKAAGDRCALTYAFGGESGTISDDAAESLEWTPPMALCAQLPRDVSGACTLSCRTYRAGALVGTRTASLTLAVPPSVKPTIESFTAARVDGGVPADWGVFVQGHSRARLLTAASGAYGAQIASCALSDGSTGTDVTTPVLTQPGEQRFTVTVTDTRGRTASQSVSISVEAYDAPTLAGVTLHRCAENGALSGGTALLACAEARFSSVAGHNAASLTLTLCDAAGASLAQSALTSGETSVCFAGAVEAAHSYRAVLRCTDSLGGSAAYTAVIPTERAALHLRAGGGGAAFGKYAEEDGCLDIAWDKLKLGGVTVDYIVEQGVSGIWTYRKWASGIAECWGMRSVSLSYPASANWGAVFSTGDVSITAVNYPFSFAAAPVCVAQAEFGSGNCWLTTAGTVGTASHTPAYQAVRPTAVSGASVTVHYSAKGRWK